MAAPRRPPIEVPPVSARRPPEEKTPPLNRVLLSFRYWDQIEFFGLKQASRGWFVSLLCRLGDIASLGLDEFRDESIDDETRRIHKIDWAAKNCPIRRENLDWIPRQYMDSPENYPIYQFAVSKGKGRVHGFFDENDVFNVVLLDPFHNLQPSRKVRYKVRPCGVAPSDIEELLANIESAQRSIPCGEPCGAHRALKSLPSASNEFPVVAVRVEPSVVADVEKLISLGAAKGWDAVIEAGVIYLQEEAGREQQGDSAR